MRNAHLGLKKVLVRVTHNTMKHKAFTEIVAKSCNIPQKTVALFARNLKEAGLLTTGARGVNAPEMTLLDLTRMVITLCATDRPAEAVEMSNRYRIARNSEAAQFTVGEKVIDVPAGEELEDFLSAMMDMPHLSFKYLDLHLFIHWNRLAAEVWIREAKILFTVDLTDEEKEKQTFGSFKGIRTTRGLAAHELSEMSLPFRLEEEDGTAWEQMVENGSAAEVASRHIFGVKGEDSADG